MAKEPQPFTQARTIRDWAPSALAAVLVTIVIVAAMSMGRPPRDNSDPIGGRSNMEVLTDALTGCQYLAAQRGGITPRMGADNKQVCN